MITLIHGDDQSAGYNYLQTLLSTADKTQTEIINLAADKTDLTDFTQALEADSLFSGSKLIIITGLLTMRRTTLQQTFLDIVNRPNLGVDIVCLETKILTKTQINKINVGGLVVKQFKLPIYLWKFLDSYAPATHRQALLLLQTRLNQTAPELIIHLLLRHLRQLIRAHGHLLGGMPSWKQTKLVTQARQFTLKRLVAHHHHLTQLSHLSKSSLSPLDCGHALTALVLSLRNMDHDGYAG